MRHFALSLCALLILPRLTAQVASVSVVDSIVAIDDVGGSNSSEEIVLFRADGTYQDLANINRFSGGAITTSPLASGTYSYSVSTANEFGGPGSAPGPQTVGTITWANRTSLQLVFFTATTGQPGPSGPGVLSGFRVFPRLVVTGAANVSNNSWISAAHPTIPGFVLEGASPRWVLIRGAGPSLAQFSVPNPVTDPSMSLSGAIDFGVNVQTVTTGNGATETSTVNSWTSDPNLVAGLQAVFSLVGAFQFISGSNDCAALVLLEPGAYTVQASTSSAGGQFLTEVYVLPYGS
jgi:hypothetical protein